MKENILKNGLVRGALAAVCCLLWGSAFPLIKIGYNLFEINTSDSMSIILFAGIRFFIAGIMCIAFLSAKEKKLVLPEKGSLGSAVILCMFQTVIQYLFFYLGLARTSGVKASIVESFSVFAALIISVFIFRQEKISAAKIIGCIVGISGVILVNMGGKSAFNFTIGDLFIFISCISYAFSTVFMKKISVRFSPAVLSGYQFMLGGIIMIVCGLIGGGKINSFTLKGLAVLLFLAFISACAYTLWSILLKYNPVSKVAVFGFLNPVFGVILSAVLLKEGSVLSIKNILALLICCFGIYLVNSEKKPKAEAFG